MKDFTPKHVHTLCPAILFTPSLKRFKPAVEGVRYEENI